MHNACTHWLHGLIHSTARLFAMQAACVGWSLRVSVMRAALPTGWPVLELCVEMMMMMKFHVNESLRDAVQLADPFPPPSAHTRTLLCLYVTTRCRCLERDPHKRPSASQLVVHLQQLAEIALLASAGAGPGGVGGVGQPLLSHLPAPPAPVLPRVGHM